VVRPGNNGNDRISVNFVTEPGLLADHHLVTRLTENTAILLLPPVRLDFDATARRLAHLGCQPK